MLLGAGGNPPAVHAPEVLGGCAPPSIFNATPHTKFGAQVKEHERGDGKTPRCPQCRKSRSVPDGNTQEMLELATPRGSQEEDSPSPTQEEDSPSPGALTLSVNSLLHSVLNSVWHALSISRISLGL